MWLVENFAIGKIGTTMMKSLIINKLVNMLAVFDHNSQKTSWSKQAT